MITFLGPMESVSAQLVGNRTLGAPALSLQQQRTGSATPGTPAIGTAFAPGVGGATGLQGGNNRFIRGNRSRSDFVGSNLTDRRGFVGSGQALGVGQVRSAVENLRIETTKSANRPLPPQPAKGMYYPRLEVGFDPPELQAVSINETIASPGIIDRVAQFSNGNVQVTMSGSTAILRGTVPSNRAAELLSQVLSFEPGIDRVMNELVVK